MLGVYAANQSGLGAGMGLSALVHDNSSISPPLSGERPIDLVHLARMTLGDRGLEREVLQLFDRQAGMLIVRMQEAARAGICAAAHTLKGSARGIGAWRVARAAEAVELAAGSAAERELEAAIARLGAAAAETRALIADLLQAH
jgi:HPt (histidine-containing phosphotransfer) domain-containing protein